MKPEDQMHKDYVSEPLQQFAAQQFAYNYIRGTTAKKDFYINKNEINLITLADVHENYAQVIRMCEGANVKPYECVTCDGVRLKSHPCFSHDPKGYAFALAIVENTPVWAGSVLYSQNGGKRTALAIHEFDKEYGKFTEIVSDRWANLSWTQQKPKTVMVEFLESDATFWRFYDPRRYRASCDNINARFYDAIKQALNEQL